MQTENTFLVERAVENRLSKATKNLMKSPSLKMLNTDSIPLVQLGSARDSQWLLLWSLTLPGFCESLRFTEVNIWDLRSPYCVLCNYVVSWKSLHYLAQKLGL